MDRYTLESLRKHGAQARSSGRGDRNKTRVTFESDSQAYRWVTERSVGRLAAMELMGKA